MIDTLVIGADVVNGKSFLCSFRQELQQPIYTERQENETAK